MRMKNPPHPGLSVRHDCHEPLGLSVSEGAKVLGVTRQAMNNLVSGKAGISAEMAFRLEKALGGGARRGYACRLPTIWPKPKNTPARSKPGVSKTP
jgi:addiction module HigA family antidote